MTHKGTVTLETERLILRRFTIDDAEAMFQNWASDPEVTRFMPYDTCITLKQTQSRINEWLDYFNKTERSDVFAIILKDSGEPIGTIDYAETDPEVEAIEVGYQLGKHWWGNGYAAEALKALIKYCFEECGFKRIWAMYNSLNSNSGTVMRKAGMQYEGTFRKDRMRKGELRDSVQYAILAEDYFNRNNEKTHKTTSNIDTIKSVTDLMFQNLWISMQTVDWNADVCGAPAWRYIYHTLHSADKYFINPTQYTEPSFHTPKLDWPDTPSEIILSRETLYEYYEQVRQKILDYVDGLTDYQLTERPNGKLSRLGLVFSQFRHMYAHIGILNGITIAQTNQYPRVLNESIKQPECLYDEDIR